MRASQHPIFFQLLKLSQLLIAIVCAILEVTEYFAYSNYVDELNASGKYPNFHMTKADYFANTTLYNGQIKIWYYIAIILTIVSISVYLFQFRKIWDKGLSMIYIELFSFALWFSSGLANLDPWYTGPGLNCSKILTDVPASVEKVFTYALLQCNIHMASLSFGWINAGLFLLSSFIGWKVLAEQGWLKGVLCWENGEGEDGEEEWRSSSRRASRHMSSRQSQPVFF